MLTSKLRQYVEVSLSRGAVAAAEQWLRLRGCGFGQHRGMRDLLHQQRHPPAGNEFVPFV